MKRFLSYFRETGTPITFRRGTNLFFQGEVPRDALLIIDGIVKASIINQTGEETIVNLYSKGALVPIVWANRQSPCSVFHYQAVNDVRAIRMNRDDLWSIIDSNAEVQRGYLEFMLSSQASTVLRLTGL